MAGNTSVPNGKPFQILQEQADATNAAIQATNDAQAAAVKALEAADAALQARDDMLQGQINTINKTLSEQLAIIDTRFNTLEGEIAQVAQDSVAADTLINKQIQLMQRAINTLNGRANQADQINAYQAKMIKILTARANNIVLTTDKDRYNASLRFRDLASAITDAMGRANSAYTLASKAYNHAANQAQYNELSSQLAAVRSKINTLDNSLGDSCAKGYYVSGVTYSGDLVCRTLTDTVTRTQNLSKYRYCVNNTFVGCVDYKHYQYGTAYCPAGYRRDSTSTYTPDGFGFLNNYPASAYLQTRTTDGSKDDIGSVTVNCSKVTTVYATYN